MPLSFRLLGTFDARRDGIALGVTARLPRTLLAVLLVHAGRVVSADALVDWLWDGEPPPSAHRTLHAYISQLRKQLRPSQILHTRGAGYLLEAGRDEVDAFAFEDLVAEGDLDGALALWQGEPLADFPDAPWARSYVTRLRELHEAAEESRADRWLEQGRHREAVTGLEEMVARQPLREHRWGQLIRALYGCGRQADALAAYRRCRAVLAEELGLEPGPELQALERAVLTRDPELHTAAREAGTAPRPPGGGPDDPRFAPVVRTEPVGREREEALLRARVLAGGGCVLLTGEAGIGKTTLAEVAGRAARAAGMPVTWIRCVDASSAPAYWPWTRLLRELPPPADRALNLLTGTRPIAGGDRFGVYEAVLAALAAEQRPRLVVLEDVHAADVSSLELLGLLAADLPRLPLLFAVTSREPVLTGSAAVERLPLGGLAERDCARLVERSLPDRADLAGELARRSGGNPFFLGELVALLAAGGEVGAVPEGVREIVLQRLGALPAPARELLSLAAVQGEALDLKVLAHACDLGPDGLMDALDTALAAGLLAESSSGGPGGSLQSGWSYRFRHGLIRDALYEALSRTGRARLHLRVAEALAATGAPAPALALHHLAAGPLGDPALAVRYAREAARLAVRRNAWSQAVSHLRDAAGVLIGPAERPLRCDVLLELAHALRDAGEHRAAYEALEEALALATALGDGDRVSAAATAFGGTTSWGSREYGECDPVVIGFLEARLGEVDDAATRVRLLTALGLELRYTDRAEDGLARTGEALELARALDDPELLAQALHGHLLISMTPSRFAALPPLIAEAIELAVRRGSRRDEFAARLNDVGERARAGDLAGLDAQLARCRDLAAELRSPELTGQLRLAEACSALMGGRWAEVERLGEEGAGLLSQTGAPGLTWSRLALETVLHRGRGTLAGRAGRLLALAEHEPWSFGLSRPAAVLALLEGGEEERARALAVRWFAPPAPDWTWMLPMSLWSEVAARLGVPDPAVLYDLLLPHAGELAVAGVGLDCGGPVDGLLAGLARARGDEAAAARHAERAEELRARLGPPGR